MLVAITHWLEGIKHDDDVGVTRARGTATDVDDMEKATEEGCVVAPDTVVDDDGQMLPVLGWRVSLDNVERLSSDGVKDREIVVGKEDGVR